MNDLGPTLIRSKLQVPTPTGLLHRSRLCHAISQGLERKLTLISAPAGYGKTSALVDFAQYTSVPVCWYTVDERDRDLSLFIRYVTGAVREQFPGFGRRTSEALASLDNNLFREPTAVVGDLVNEMLDLGESFILVIDNFEPLNGAVGIREFIHRLLEVLPSNCHLMVASRVLPDIPVTRLVAKRQLVGLTERDLSFEPGEVQSLLQRSGIQISEAQAQAIARNAEGWITGILLVSDLIQGDAAAVIADVERATSQTYGYLASEVLTRQPPDVQRFLFDSSVLREMSARLCRQALGIRGAQSLLDEVERRNLFITRFGDDGGAVYRYHNLFRDFVQRHFRGREPDRYAALHRRAGDWLKEDHQVEEAVYHYLAGEAYEDGIELMERVAMEWFTRGRVETLLRWADALPPDIKDRAPRLFLYQGKALADRYEYDRAREALAYAETGFTRRGNVGRVARVRLQRAAVELYEGHYEEVVTEAEEALEMLGPPDAAARAQARRLVGRAYLAQGRFEEGVGQLEEALAWYREFGSAYNVVTLLQDLTLAYASRGRFARAAEYLNEALPIARRLDAPELLALVLNNLGMLHYEREDYRRALALHQEGLTVAQRADDRQNQGHLADGMATIYRDAGLYRAAESLYDVAWQIARKHRPEEAVDVLVARADMYRWQGDRTRALALLKNAEEIAAQRGIESGESARVALGKGIALAEAGEIERGVRLLVDAVESLDKQGADNDLARGLFLLAEARLLNDEKSQALKLLHRAMSLTDETGTRRFAVAEGRRAKGLVELGIEEGVPGCRELAAGIERLRAFGRELTQGVVEREERLRRHLRVYAFGEGRVVREGQPIPSSAWQAAMARELFFYILFHGPVERDAVGLIFWPDLPAEKVTNNFHSTLYRVRRAVGSETVVVKDGEYQLGNVDYWCDVEEFETLVERARLLPPHDWQAEELWRRAAELYQGDFLTGVDRSWCVPKREALRAKHLEALIGIGRCHEVRGAYEDAISWYRRALQKDKLREDIHRYVMRCYAEAGRRAKALEQYRSCQEVLVRELGVRPSPETTRFYEKIAGKAGD